MSFLKAAILIIVTGLLCLADPASAYASEPSPGKGDRDKPLVVAFTPQVFFNVDPRDAIGVARVWFNTIDRRIQNPTETSVVFFSTEQETEGALKRNEVDILILISEDFVRLRDRFDLMPVLSSDYGKRFYDELLILVRDDSGITRLEQLRGKSLKVEGGQKGSVPMRWLDSELQKKCSNEARSFFSELTQHPKASQVIMPVFFGKATACLTSSNSYEILAEMNPQLARQLRVVDRSPGFATGIIAVRRDVRNPWRDAMVAALMNSDADPKGRQLMAMFRINRLVQFRPEHLTTVEKVLMRHPARPAGAPRGKR